MSLDRADALRQVRHIKIGLVACRAKEIITPLRCFRCLEYGHNSQKCEGEDRSTQGLNCGKEEHRVQECKEEPICRKCKVVGHRMNTMRCPEFRDMVYGRRNK